jgi:ankyrin repeat protein
MTWTQLHEACEHQDVKSVIALSRLHSEDAFKADAHGYTPLHIMCWGNPNPRAIAALLEACPQALTDQDVHGDTPLHIACRCRSTEKHLVQMLLTSCPTAASMTNIEGLTPLHVACRYYAPNKEGIIGLLVDTYPYALRSHIKVGSPGPRKGASPLTEIKGTDHAIIDPSAGMRTKDSVDLRFDATDPQIRDGAYPLHMAIVAGAPLAVVEMLIKEADDVLLKANKFGETPLHSALMCRRDSDMVQVLIGCGPGAVRLQEKQHGNLPIHTAATAGLSVNVAKCLIKTWPESIHEKNVDGLTPLEVAAQTNKCSEEVLRLLEISDHAV